MILIISSRHTRSTPAILTTFTAQASNKPKSQRAEFLPCPPRSRGSSHLKNCHKSRLYGPA
ncbi:hypothetical protein BC567DRAFT_221503 [Phyllosticta citribraziliensis]